MRAVPIFAIILGLLVSALASTKPLFAAEPKQVGTELREFEVLVDDNKSGSSKLTITDYDDGRSVAATSADIRVSILVYTYAYQFNGAEEWTGDRLSSLDSRTVDGLSKLTLKARVDTDRTVLQTADGKVRTAPLHVLSTNFWRLPPSSMLGKKIPVIDADTGKTLQLAFQHVGTKPLTLLGKSIDCEYFKVSGDKAFELWFDGSGRLVRQIGSEDGHKTELRLAGYRPAERNRGR